MEQAHAQLPAPFANEGTVISGLKLLIADDSVTIQKVVELTFLDEGMEVASVGDGRQAIDKLEEFAPDVVLADVFMPGRTGYEVCAAIKHHERFHDIPVMLLVGSFEPFDEAEARRVGADDVLTKPFQSIRQLVNRVGTLLGGTPAQTEATTRDLSALGLEPGAETDAAAAARTDVPAASDQAGANLMSTAEIELTTADTKPLDEAQSGEQPTAFAGDDRMANPMTEPVVDMAEPFAADVDEFDGLLDLGDLDSPRSQPAYADSILELEDLTIAAPATEAAPSEPEIASSSPEFATTSPQPSYESEVEPGWSDSSTLTPAEKYAAVEQEADNREQIEVAAWDIVPSLISVDAKLDEPESVESSMPASMAPQTEMAHEDAAGELSAQPAALASDAAGRQLSAADVDAIARRAVELMSDSVVREIAWEVVPELAELLIKRRLEEQ